MKLLFRPGMIIPLLLVSFCDGQQVQFPGQGGVVQFLGVFTKSSGAAAEAARLAIADINAYNVRTKLPLRVELIEGKDVVGIPSSGETQCGAKEDPISLMGRLMNRRNDGLSSPKPVILAGCQADCAHLAQQGLNDAIIMCYGERSRVTRMEVSSSEMFILQPDPCTMITPLIKLIFHFGWRKVGVVNFFGDPLTQVSNLLASVLEEHGIQVGSLLFGSTTLEQLERHHFRIVIVVGGEIGGREMLCAIYRAAHVKRFAWIFIGPTGRDWVMQQQGGPPSGCRVDQLVDAGEGHLILTPMVWHPDPNLRTVCNRTASSFRREMLRRVGGSQPDFEEAPLAYDSVWAGYTAVATSLLKCGGGAACPVHVDDTLNDISFPGVSGDVSFREGKRSVMGVSIRVDQFKSGHYDEVAFHFNGNNSWSWIRDRPFGAVTPEDGFGLGEEIIDSDGIPFPPYPQPTPIPPSTQNSAMKFFILRNFAIPIVTICSIKCILLSILYE